jgi:hypothetical protein
MTVLVFLMESVGYINVYTVTIVCGPDAFSPVFPYFCVFTICLHLHSVLLSKMVYINEIIILVP